MSKAQPTDQILIDARRLYFKYGGHNMPAIQREMRKAGYPNFSAQRIRKKVKGEYQGWESEYGWKKQLEEYLEKERLGMLQTHEERLYHEIESIRQRLYEQIQASGVTNRDLIWQHDKYSQRSMELLEMIEKARAGTIKFPDFLEFLIRISMEISPKLANELVNAEETIIKRAKIEFASK